MNTIITIDVNWPEPCQRGIIKGSDSCENCHNFVRRLNDFAIECSYPTPKQKICWRKCKAGYKFPSDAIVIPNDDRTTDRDPRLVRCAVWDSKYILIDELKKLPVDNG